MIVDVKKTFYITKWALTRGIVKAEGCEVTDSGYATRRPGRYSSLDYIFARIGKDAFYTEKEAQERVKKKIQARIKAIETERKRLTVLAATLP